MPDRMTVYIFVLLRAIEPQFFDYLLLNIPAFFGTVVFFGIPHIPTMYFW